MKPFRWSSDKNVWLVAERGISFEEITVAVEAGGLTEVVAHPNPRKYPGQRIMVVAVVGYAYLVPCVEEADHFFLKTIVPSRKATRDFIERGDRTMSKLDPYELELLRAYESGKLEPAAGRAELQRLRAAARATAIKDKRVNIRLSSVDLLDIQARALAEGMPYQTLIASVLHKYVTGRLAKSRPSAAGAKRRATSGTS